MSTPLYAIQACTRADGGGWWCWEVDDVDYNVGFTQTGSGGSTGMPGPGDVGGQTGFGGGGTLGGAVRIGKILISADDWITVAQAAGYFGELTVEWGKADIVRFRESNGLHVMNPQFSLIPWQLAQVNWNLYGANNPSLSTEDIWSNFRDAMHDRMGG